MEAITLCGLIIVVFGLWEEFGFAIWAIIRFISKCKFMAIFFSNSSVHRPEYLQRMPLCVARSLVFEKIKLKPAMYSRVRQA